MKTQGLVFVGIAGFMAVIALVYWFVSYEPAGTTMLGVTLGLAVIPGASLLWWARRAAPVPADRADAEPDDAAGVVGSFPESSVWPVVLAGGAALLGAGLVFGVWAGLPGLLTVGIAFVGATLESRGRHG